MTHSTVDPKKAVEHLRKDPGLPVSDPLPSLWQEPQSELHNTRSTALPQETDVVIIGSGITGCSIAKHLLEKDDKVRVVVLEARGLTSGATGRNGGHVMVIPELFYAGFNAAYGHDVAEEVVNFTIANQDAVLGLADELPQAVREYSELRKLEVLHVFVSEKAKSNAIERIAGLEAAMSGLKRRNRFISKEELLRDYGIKDALGGATMLAGAAYPYRVVSSVFAQLKERFGNRLSIETNTPAESISWDGDYKVKTPRGLITAKDIVHATNAHAGHLLPSLRGFVQPIGCQVAPSFPNLGAQNTWCIGVPGALHSVYQSPITGDFFLSGHVGLSNFFEEYTSADNKSSPQLVNHMSATMNKVFGKEVQQPSIKAEWTGIMGYTADGVPLVGRLHEDLTGREGSGEWIAAGFNGIGMVTAWLSGEHIADSVLGKSPRKIPDLYIPSKERVDRADLGSVVHRSYAAWE